MTHRTAKISGRRERTRSKPALKAKRRTYTIILEAERDPEFKGYYNVRVPAIPGCFTYGATKAEALRNARDAIACNLEMLAKEGQEAPEDLKPTVQTIRLAV